jgi:TP901 family phage tail tape measure protein
MANVTGQDATTVSDQLTAIWNNFNKAGDVAYEHYADILTALGAETASSTDEIAGGLEKFAAVAETIGLSYEYATAALATVTAETRQSADVVGTAFKTLFARI